MLPNTIELLCWHLNRYDHLRSSTASRASVVLSAGTILFAGDAIVLSQMSDSPIPWTERWTTVVVLAMTLMSSLLVVLSLLRAANVLVTPRRSRTMFLRDEQVPSGLVFTASDTVDQIPRFADFRQVLATQDEANVIETAQVELWICIRQHRHRYLRLRSSVRYLRYAAVSFAVVLVMVMFADAIGT